jgi:hypothetical protein
MRASPGAPSFSEQYHYLGQLFDCPEIGESEIAALGRDGHIAMFDGRFVFGPTAAGFWITVASTPFGLPNQIHCE